MREIIMWLQRDERYLLIVYCISTPELNIEGPMFSVDDLQPFVIKPPCVPIWGTRNVVKLARELIKNKHNNDLTCDHIKKETDAENNYATKQKTNNKYKVWFEAKCKIEAANKMLKKRDLVEVSECGNYYYKINEMKLKGLDLGGKYMSFWFRSDLWYTEYIKHHWIWIFGSFFSGIFTTLLVQWLIKIIK